MQYKNCNIIFGIENDLLPPFGCCQKKHPVLNLQAPLRVLRIAKSGEGRMKARVRVFPKEGILKKFRMVMKCHCDDENENVKKNDLHQVAAHAIGRVGRVDWLKIETI